jgi:hypothetical protein
MPEFGEQEVPLEEKSQGETLEEAKVDTHLFSEAIIPFLKLKQEMGKEEAIAKVANQFGFDGAAFSGWLDTLAQKPAERPAVVRAPVRLPEKTKTKRRKKWSDEEIADMWFNKEPMA